MNNLVSKEEYKNRLIEIIESIVKLDKNVIKFKEKLLDSSNYGDNYHTNPKEMSFEISSTGETAYQRAILKSKKTFLDLKNNNDFETVEWMDGELPIVLNKNPRRAAIDLIGSLDGTPTICELKFTNSKSLDSPYYAVIELLTYYCFIQFNADFLDKYNVYHKNLNHLKWDVITKNSFTRLIVCANKLYWDKWLKKIDKTTLQNQVCQWGVHLDTNISLFQSEDFDFKFQKGNKEKYTPSIPEKSIWKIIKEETTEEEK